MPALLRAGYDKGVASGAICASGTLRWIIPPSLILILLADIMTLSVGTLFAAAVFPGLLRAAFYVTCLLVLGMVRPAMVPAVPGAMVVCVLGGRLTLRLIWDTAGATARNTAMMMFILICARVLALAFRGLQGEQLIHKLFEFLPGGVAADIWFLMLLVFVLGFFLAWIEISDIAVPLFLPVFAQAGVDPV
mgnify:CR=1 FL=1